MKRLIIVLCAAWIFIATTSAAEPTVIKPEWEVKLPPYSPYDGAGDNEAYEKSFELCREIIADARKGLIERKLPTISEYRSTIVNQEIVAQTPFGPHSYSSPGVLEWMHDTDLNMVELNARHRRSSLEATWLSGEKLARAVQVFTNSVIGRAVNAGELVFIVNDLSLFPLKPHPRPTSTSFARFESLRSNSIRGINPESGKWIRAFGSYFQSDADPELWKSHFLGHPFGYGEHLYVLNEKDNELRLVGFEAMHALLPRDLPRPKGVEAPKLRGVVLATTLLHVSESTSIDHHRRIHALIPIATDKLIICPTHLGAVVAVNRDDHKVAWTARYGKPEDKRFENFSCTWRVRPMLVAGDLVIYGPADAESLYAFKLADGKEAWKLERGKGVYLAGLHDGKAIVVDSNAIRAIDATNGKEVWKVPFEGTLTGYGVLSGERFYQPIGRGKNADEGILQVIELKQGKEAGTIQRADKKEFGNLLIHKGKLISQTFESLSVFAMP